jgi:hypothetical protein
LLAVLALLSPNAVWIITASLVSAAGYYTLVLAKDHSLRDYLIAFLPQRVRRAE